jgi:hypothetical protein
MPDEGAHFREFPVAAPGCVEANGGTGSLALERERPVLSSRAMTGIGGVIVVTALLLAMQLISGVEAFPL